MVEFVLGVLVGALIIGVLANRKPEWFATVASVSRIVNLVRPQPSRRRTKKLGSFKGLVTP